MAAPTKDTERGNIHTGTLQIKIRLDTNNVVSIKNEHIQECFFVEDIFSTCMTGRLSFIDNYGMYEFGPFTGNETVSIVYGRVDNREVVFHIMKVERIISSAASSPQVSPVVVLELADTSFEWFMNYRYSRSYEANLKSTDVVRHVIKHQVGWENENQLNIMQSSSELGSNFCIPYWTPKQTVDYILSFAWTKEHYGYLCYGNTYNRQTINVVPLTYLLSKNNTTDENTYKLETNSETEDPMELKGKILEWWIDGIDHTQTRTIRNTKMYGFNIGTKKAYSNIVDYTDGIKNTPVLGNFTLFENGYDKGGSNTSSDGTFSSVSIGNGMESEIGLRKYFLNHFVKQYCMHQLVNIIVIGNERRYAGHQILIDWSSVNQESKVKNKLFDGPYLVKSITHDFIDNGSSFGYVQRMVLIKNGFQNPSTRLLKKSTNINITGGVRTNEFGTV